MPRYRYRPADNRTPVADPVFGPLTYDGVYDDPRCAEDDRFELIPDGEEPGQPDTAAAGEQTVDQAPQDAGAYATGGIVTPWSGTPDPTPPAALDGLTEHETEPPAEPEQADADELGEE